MHVARSIAIIFLILVIIVGSHPLVRENVSGTWENIRPVVVALMDSSYAMIRSFIAGDGSHDRMDGPPGNPGVNFDRIVTMNNDFLV